MVSSPRSMPYSILGFYLPTTLTRLGGHLEYWKDLFNNNHLRLNKNLYLIFLKIPYSYDLQVLKAFEGNYELCHKLLLSLL